MKRVLVTGGTGFIGRWTVGILADRGYEVHVVGRQAPPRALLDDRVHFHPADLLLAGEAQRVAEEIRATHLLHLAWETEHGKFWTAASNLAWLRTSLELIESFTLAGGKRIVVSGTCAEYDWSNPLCTERKTALSPKSFYSVSKDSLRKMLKAYAAIHDFSWAWGRLFFSYGPFEAPGRLVPSVVRSLLKKETASCTHGRQIRDFLHSADVGRALVELLDSEVEGEINIASGEPTTIAEVVGAIADQLSAREELRLGARTAPADDPPSVLADVSRLRDEVGFTPHFSLNSGLKDTITFWRNEAGGLT